MNDTDHSESSCHSCHSYGIMRFPALEKQPQEMDKEVVLSESVPAKKL
jgi:nitrate/TMAO reductase-like tetraheme cytochrome c subunit